MIESTIPYSPSLEKLFQLFKELFDIIEQDSLTDELVTDDYFKTLIKYNFIDKNENDYIISECKGLVTTDFDKFLFLFQEQIEKDSVVLGVQKYAEEKLDGFLYDDIINDISSLYSTQDIRVVLSWMETLKQLYLKNGKYLLVINESEYDDDLNSDGIYPLDYNTVVDIKEEKYSVFEYLRKVERGDIFMNPDFQRNLVWKNIQKSQFIESAILNIPVPPIYLKRTLEGKYIVVDGLQRTNALREFLSSSFALIGLEALKELNGKTFVDFKQNKIFESLATKIEDKQLLFYVLQPSISMSLVYDIFNRINTGGTKLERQEIRNCIFIGHSTQLLKELSEEPIFIEAIKNGISPLRMKDREAILRCLAFEMFDYKTDYYNSMDDFLERTMRKLNKMTAIQIQDIRSRFLHTMKLTFNLFGETNFRIPNGTNKGRINIAVMETIYCFFSKKRNVIEDSLYILYKKRFKELINNPDYRNSVRFSTGTKSNVINRFTIANNILTQEENDKEN